MTTETNGPNLPKDHKLIIPEESPDFSYSLKKQIGKEWVTCMTMIQGKPEYISDTSYALFQAKVRLYFKRYKG